MKILRSKRVRPLVEQLEPRILYSADLNPALVHDPVVAPQIEHRVIDTNGEFTHIGASDTQLSRYEVVFVDTATPDYQRLIDDIRSNGQDGRTLEVVLLDHARDGIKQITDFLGTRTDISAVHIISHGSDGSVQLGGATLNFDSLLKNASSIKGWGNALTADADILLYGCDVAATAQGQSLVQALGRLTGADVAASTDLTGNAAQGGDWNLEYRTGSIETDLAVDSIGQRQWQGVLVAPVAVNDAYSVNEDTTLVVAPSNANLVNWWNFNEGGSSQTIASAGSLADSGTLGSTAGVDAADPTWTTGYVGGAALSFDGAGDYVETSSTDLKTASNFTLSAWFQTDTTTGAHHILWAGYPGGNGYGNGGSTTPATSEMSLSIGSYTAAYDNKIVFFLGYDVPPADPNSIFIVSSSTFTDTAAWHHVAVSVSDVGGGVMSASLYVDGQLEGTDVGTENDRSSWGALRIGAPGDGSRSFDGKIDEVRIYNTPLSGAQVQGITQAGVLSNDTDVDSPRLTVNTGVVTGPANGTLSISSDGSFTYTPNANFNGTDTFTYRANDDTANSNVATVTITVNPVNDAPVGTNKTVTTLEDTDYTFTAANFGFTDPADAAQTAGANALLNVRITTLPGAGSLNLSGAAVTAGQLVSVLDIDAGNLKFTPALNANGAGYASFTFQVQDDGGTANGGVNLDATPRTMTVDVTPVNDAPVVTATGTTLAYTENAAATAIDTGLTVSDVDSTNLNGATVTISANYANGEDALAFTNQLGITGSWNAATGVLTLTGATTVANYQTALRSVTYFNSSDAPGTLTRTVSFVVNDGAANSSAATRNISVTAVNDAPVGVLTISGTATENQTLTASTAGISDADGLGAFGYQWLRNGVAVGGATASTYTLGNGDVGAPISVQVSYTDAYGTAEGPLTSAQTAAVANVNDAPVGVPTISGTATENQTLTASTGGISDADGLGAFGYQWLRNGVAVGGATASTYTLGNADVGAQMSVQVSYTDGHGTNEGPLTSAQTAAVANVNDAPMGVPTISGTATENQTLTASTSGISDADGLGAFGYQWLRNGVAVGGATATTYTLGNADVGAQMSVQVSYTDAHGTNEGPLTSAQTAAVANVNDAPVGVPTISGTVTENQTLTASAAGISDADGLGAFGYQWLRNGVAIGGATSNTYTLGDADVGTQMSVQVSYTDAHGTNEGPLTSAQTAAIGNVNDAPVGVPTISGTTTENQTLSASTAGISDADGLGAFGYQWLRNGVAVGGATASTYTLGNADVGAQISVQVSYTDAHGTAEGPLTSAQTAAIGNVNDAPVGANNTVSILQDTSHVFGVTDFGFSDPNDAPANNLLAVRISTLPLAGSLTDNGAPVTAGQLVGVADINAGWLVFTPANGVSGTGYASLTFQVQDDGGTVSGGVDFDTAPRTMTINVTQPGAGPVVMVIPTPIVSVDQNVDPPPLVPQDAQPPAPAAGPGNSQGGEPPVQDRVTIVVSGGGQAVGLDFKAPEYANRLSAGPIRQPNGADTSSRRWSEFAQPTPVALDPKFINAAEYTSGMSPGKDFGVTASLIGTDFGEEEKKSFWNVENAAQLTGLVVSAGFVAWALRGAGLVTSLLASTPAWRNLDPLPVLGDDDEDKNKEDHVDADEEATRDEFAVSDLWAGEGGTQPAQSNANAPGLPRPAAGTSRGNASAKKGPT
jgi:VCBS repeat-containing protein